MSSRREPTDILAGAWPAATPPSRDDIRDEIEDHLACGVADLTAAGMPTEEAEERSRAAFGDVEAVARELYWLHHGRRLMVQRVMLGSLAAVCAVLAIVSVMVYRQSAATAGAVSDLQATVASLDAGITRVRLTLSSAAGEPLAGREVYIWPRRIEEAPFPAPNTSMLWMRPMKDEAMMRVTLPEAYELLVTDKDGVINLGQRPAGTYTAAVSVDPELEAGEWIDEQMRRRDEPPDRSQSLYWVGYAQQVFDVPTTSQPVAVELRLPEMARTNVEFVAPPGFDVRRAMEPNVWLMVEGRGNGMRVWLRARTKLPPFVDEITSLELPLTAQATLHVGYRVLRPRIGGTSRPARDARADSTMPLVLQTDVSTGGGIEPRVQLTVPGGG
ncbi:MAG: permease prefix domain 1-containing protein [Phycisphaerae bacterium]|jgi:hypothetical protein